MACYVIARMDVHDPAAYAEYASQTVAIAEKYGGRFLVKAGEMQQLEGTGPERHVVVEFPDKPSALAYYNSPEYQKILPIALANATRDIVVVEGV